MTACTSNIQRCLLACLLVAAGLVLLPRSARADLRDAGTHHRPQMLSVFTGFHFDFKHGSGLPVALSGRYYYPIVPDGFARNLNDEFGIEGGIDMLFKFGSRGDLGIGLPVAGLYDLHFSEKFDAYAKLGFSVHIDRGARAFPYAAVGMRLKLNESLYFRVEGGYPVVLVGLGFAF